MGTFNANVPNLNAKMIAKEYIMIELRKLFSDISDQKVWHQIDQSINTLESRTNPSTLWGLVSGISESIRLNSVHEYLTDDTWKWELKTIYIEKLMLTGMGPPLDRYILEICGGSPSAFFNLWSKDEKVREICASSGIGILNSLNIKPLIVFEKQGKYYLLDGMHRALSAIISNEKSITVWVGINSNPLGKPLINGSMCMLLWKLWKNSDNKDAYLKDSIHSVASEISQQYRNGQKTIVDRIMGWSSQAEMNELFKGL